LKSNLLMRYQLIKYVFLFKQYAVPKLVNNKAIRISISVQTELIQPVNNRKNGPDNFLLSIYAADIQRNLPIRHSHTY